MAYVIERGIPIPPDTEPAGNERYPLRRLKLGDIFFVPRLSPSAAIMKQLTIRSLSQRYGVPVEMRTVDGGLRVWRVA